MSRAHTTCRAKDARVTRAFYKLFLFGRRVAESISISDFIIYILAGERIVCSNFVYCEGWPVLWVCDCGV